MKHIILVLAILASALPCVAQRALTTAEISARTYSLTIAQGATTTEAVASLSRRFGCTPSAILFPAAMTGATLSVLASFDGTTYGALVDPYTGAAITVKVTVSSVVPLPLAEMWSFSDLKFVSASAEAAARTLKVKCAGVR